MSDLSDVLSDYSFELPETLIAQEPSPHPEDARLLVVRRHPNPGEPRFEDLQVRDLPDLVAATPSLKNALWVRNCSRVIPARFYVKRPTGGRHEIVLLEEEAPGEWSALIRGQSAFRYPQSLSSELRPEISWTSSSPGRIRWNPENPLDLPTFLEKCGEMPLPPYIKKRAADRDRLRYQPIWADPQQAASVAAPTASLHFTPEICKKLEALSQNFADIVLHVGLGTFEPVRTPLLSQHHLHSERISVSPENLKLLKSALLEKRPLIALGTTALRTLESLPLSAEHAPPSQVELTLTPSGGLTGRTSLFIRPGASFRYTRALFTNFHLPESTLLVLVATFAASRTLALEAYRHAVRKSYRFFSFGDASLWI